MGDAVVCLHCGLDKYPEVIPLQVWWAKQNGFYIPCDHPQYENYAAKARAARERRQMISKGVD